MTDGNGGDVFQMAGKMWLPARASRVTIDDLAEFEADVEDRELTWMTSRRRTTTEATSSTTAGRAPSRDQAE